MAFEKLELSDLRNRPLGADVRCRVKKNPKSRLPVVEIDISKAVADKLGWKHGMKLHVLRGTGPDFGQLCLETAPAETAGASIRIVSAGKNVRAVRVTMRREAGLEVIFPPLASTTEMPVVKSVPGGRVIGAEKSIPARLIVIVPQSWRRPEDGKVKGKGAESK
jgi:hypothetical protein